MQRKRERRRIRESRATDSISSSEKAEETGCSAILGHVLHPAVATQAAAGCFN